MKKNYLFIYLSSTLVLFSCNSTNEDIFENKAETDSFSVSADLASDIARTTPWSIFNVETKAPSALELKKEVKSIETVPGEGHDILFYVINYKDNGFLILSADKRNDPILAYSDENSFDLNADYFPSGLVDWMSATKEVMEYERKTKKEENPLWKSLTFSETGVLTRGVTPPTQPDPDEIINVVYKYLDFPMTWGQQGGYNSLLPSLSCTTSGYAYAGCGIVAMASVMRYHQFPSKYNWAGMPANMATNATATLIKDVFDAARTQYACDGTGTNDNSVINGFKKFGYNNVNCSDYRSDIVKNQIVEYEWPVIFAGGSQSNWLIFPIYVDGHAWVCNGYHSWQQGVAGYVKYHMRWGYYGDYDGWYGYGNFDTVKFSYNYKNRIYHGIVPN